jgi:hypothetical protein
MQNRVLLPSHLATSNDMPASSVVAEKVGVRVYGVPWLDWSVPSLVYHHIVCKSSPFLFAFCHAFGYLREMRFFMSASGALLSWEAAGRISF